MNHEKTKIESQLSQIAQRAAQEEGYPFVLPATFKQTPQGRWEVASKFGETLVTIDSSGNVANIERRVLLDNDGSRGFFLKELFENVLRRLRIRD